MLEKIRKMKNKKGFTLVELIVVLVILAILAALLVPALTGYIDKAREQSLINEATYVLTAAQATVSEAYGNEELVVGTDGKVTINTTKNSNAAKDMANQINQLAELKGKDKRNWTLSVSAGTEDNYKTIKVNVLAYTDGKNAIVYNNGTWESVQKGKTLTNGDSMATLPTDYTKTVAMSDAGTN